MPSSSARASDLACSASATSPSSAISPSTATRRRAGNGGEGPQGGRHRRRVGVVGVVQHDGAPVGAVASSIRHGDSDGVGEARRDVVDGDAAGQCRRRRGEGVGRPGARRGPRGRPRRAPDGERRANAGRAARRRAGRRRRRRRRRARPPPSSDSTRAGVRSAMAATRGSSALSTAVPAAGSASTSSPFAAATSSIEPNISVWACDHGGDDADRRSGDVAQQGDVAAPARAHLDDRRLGAVGRVGEGEGHAELVVEGPLARRRAPAAAPGRRRRGP